MIFIIGGEGFVGSAFVRWCAANGAEHAVITRSNFDRFRGKACSVVVNANGNSRKPLATRDPLFDFDASVRSVRDSTVSLRFDRYVFLSSCDVYPDCSRADASCETSVLDATQQSTYGLHKYLAEQLVRQVAPKWQIYRLGGMVGPGLKKNAVFDVLAGGQVFVDPASRFQYLHTDHVADIVMGLAGDGAADGEVFNLCGQGNVSVEEVAALAGVQLTGGGPCVNFDVAVAKIGRVVSLPTTRMVVSDFLGA